jgi:hypothetical protein
MKNIFTLLFILLTLCGEAQKTFPQKQGGSMFSIRCANLNIEIDSARGARITSFKISDNELLCTAYTDNNRIGSTFWPSPQSVWSWPPLPNLDHKAYFAEMKGSKIKFTGSTDPKTQLRFYKTLYANTQDTSIVVEYTMKNEKSLEQTWAPWEITRVMAKGLTLFATGNGEITGNMTSRTKEVNGYGWYDQDHMATSDGSKFFCDGKGWLAHVIDGNKLLIKQFEDIAEGKAAPDEAEVEVYTAPGNGYTELENQGAYVSIPANDSVTWTVKWFARTLPASVDVHVGSPSLTSFILSVLGRSSDKQAKK